ncbi:hypothetical protein PT2222_300091 [Paraburkholderia tropica]
MRINMHLPRLLSERYKSQLDIAHLKV